VRAAGALLHFTVYRDEREALLQRADALERELADNQAKVSEQDEELEIADQRMAAQERELAHLRKRLAKLEPQRADPQPAQKRAFVMMGAVMALAVAGGAMFFVTSSKPPPTPRPPTPIAKLPPLPDNVNRTMINAGMQKVRSDVAACKTLRGDGSGTITATVLVNPDGSVRSATALPAGPLATCVRDAVEKAHFDRTDNGFRFTYPFAFR